MWQPLKGLPAVGAIIVVLAFAVEATGATATTSNVYSVDPVHVPGVDTGLVLKKGHPVTITATGTVCPGTGYCTTPDGKPGVDTSSMAFGGFLQPQAPAYGLVGRVGSGPWMQVGSGPTQLSGKGDLVFAFNDDLYPDNTGAFSVTVSYTRGSASQQSSGCQPGNGTGDKNHVHDGPPGQGGDACYPGHGYGDKNHTHDGPPGQNTDPPGRNADPPGQNKGSDEHGNGHR